MSSLSPDDGDLHDDVDPSLHRWWPPGYPDERADRVWIARAKHHANAHAARGDRPAVAARRPADEESTVEIWQR